ncbi:MAG: NAD(P)-dependent glycerol-3-phosphate dehydrogenase [Bdellovibrionales bacterium]|nr:NAD(P)-dependent glycerol-3-phosphate dehydrogenase [Bdellovibrionales bacterium]
MKRDFWRKSTIAVIGGGSWGTVLANLAAENCPEVRVWLRDEESVRAVNATRSHPKYLPDIKLNARIRALHDFERVFDGGVHAVIWALPAKACRERAREAARFFTGSEVLLHATKGVESESLKRISVVLEEEIPCPRVGVISGPNLAHEIATGKPAATVVASRFREVVEAGQEILSTSKFRVYGGTDVIGVEWAGTLKNVIAIASGWLDGLGLGENARAMLIARGISEMVRLGTAFGGQQSSFLGLAGVGDVIATCTSPLSRNYRVGLGLAQGLSLDAILEELGSTAEGIQTARTVWVFSRERRLHVPIFERVHRVLIGELSVAQALDELMSEPVSQDISVS